MEIKEALKKFKPSQGAKEITGLLTELKKIKPKVIVEIGVHLGESIRVWNEVLAPEQIIGIDNERTMAAESLVDQYHNIVLRWGDSGDPETLDVIERILHGQQIDFLFIDGDHRYAQVMADFENYKPFVRKGGIIAIHDVSLEGAQWSNLVETKAVFDLLSQSYKTKLIHSDGSGVGLIYL